MGKYAQLIMGPAGSGKSTYCYRLQQHLADMKRRVDIVNMDPAAEDPLPYTPSVDIRDLVRADDLAAARRCGPNGALLAAVQAVVDNIEWLLAKLGDYEDDYLLFDCPGQLELYAHGDSIRQLAESLQDQAGYRIAAVYLVDAHFFADAGAYTSAVLAALAAMVRLELPHINVLSKMDCAKAAMPKRLTSTREGMRRFYRRGRHAKGFFTDDPADYGGAPDDVDLDAPEDEDGDEDEDEDEDDGSGKMHLRDDALEDALDRYCEADMDYVLLRLAEDTPKKFRKLNKALSKLLEEFALVSFVPLDWRRQGSVETLIYEIDNALQYGEDEEPRDPDDREMQNNEDEPADEDMINALSGAGAGYTANDMGLGPSVGEMDDND